jgi:TRAP-type transport system large permease protein
VAPGQLFDPQILAQNLINGADSFPLLAVPFFMLAGEMMNVGGLSRRIVNLAMALVGHLRGGLGYVAILAAVLMASLSGSAVADTAALAALLLPMMRRPATTGARRRPDRLGRHHRAGHPAVDRLRRLRRRGQRVDRQAVHGRHRAGVLMGVAIAVDLVVGRRGARTSTPPPKASRAERCGAARSVDLGLGAAGDRAGGLKIRRVHAHRSRGGRGGLRAVRRDGRLPRAEAVAAARGVRRGRQDHVGGHVPRCRGDGLGLADHGGPILPAELIALLQPLMDSPTLLLVVIMLLVIAVGTAMDMTPTILILTPVLMPMVKAAGIDPVYFGVLFIMNNAIGLITPPVGTVLNVVAGVGKMKMDEVDARRPALHAGPVRASCSCWCCSRRSCCGR